MNKGGFFCCPLFVCLTRGVNAILVRSVLATIKGNLSIIPDIFEADIYDYQYRQSIVHQKGRNLIGCVPQDLLRYYVPDKNNTSWCWRFLLRFSRFLDVRSILLKYLFWLEGLANWLKRMLMLIKYCWFCLFLRVPSPYRCFNSWLQQQQHAYSMFFSKVWLMLAHSTTNP